MSVVKIGILTFHRCINYGSYWQARCLAEGLRARGHDAVILDHASRRIDIAEWKCALQPTRPAATPKADHPRYREKILRFLHAIESLPLSARFPLDAPVDMERCDVVMVGSDEVWNLSHPWYGHCALFYGDGLDGERLVSYAASFGNYDAWQGLGRAWARRLRRFESISVRDESSRAIVADALGTEPPLVLDPCLQFPLQYGCDDGDGAQLPARYLAVYGHGFSPAFAARARRWARRRGLPVVSIGYRNDWADRQWIDAGPREFAPFIAGAEAVATNFFHGCVFALRHARPFVCEESRYRSTKLRGLMAAVGGERRLQPEGAPGSESDGLLDAPPEPAMLARIDRFRRDSERYLDRALAS